MTTESQRIALAEFDGFQLAVGFTKDQCQYGWFHKGSPHFSMLPDYPNDLNAMHKVERFLFQSKPGFYKWAYFYVIVLIVDGIDISAEGTPDLRSITGCVSATAAQRCEALLKTIGKWKD